MRGGHQVAALDLQVVHRRDRQAAAHAHPARAVVAAEEHAGFGADEQQAGAHRVGAQHARDFARGQVAVDGLPGLATVAGAKQKGPVVGQLVARGGQVHRVRIVRRDFDAAHVGQFGHRLGCNVNPALAVVARDMHQPVIGAGPDLARAVRRRRHAGAGGMHFGAGRVMRERAAGIALAAGIVQAQVGRNGGPARAFIARAKNAVAAGIQRLGVTRRKHQREGPGEAVLQVFRCHTG